MEFYIHPSSIVDDGCKIGKGSKIWHFTHLMRDVIIGEDCTIGQNVMIGSGVILGNNVKVQNNVSLYTGVICEDHVFLGPSMVFTNVINPRSEISRRNEFKKTLVKTGATIGANATIICGIEIGEYAFVGAGAVVTKSVKAYSMVIGNPARHKGWVSEWGLPLLFGKEHIATCPESQQQYQLKDNVVKKIR